MSTNTPRAGSETFGTSVMKTDEVLLMAKCAISEGIPKEEVMAHIECMDDMLSIGRMAPIIVSQAKTATGRIRKNSSYMSMLERRIDTLVQELKG